VVEDVIGISWTIFLYCTLGSEVADVPKPKRSKRDQNLRQLKQGELAPSSVTWGLLHVNSDVPDFSQLCNLPELQVDGTLCKGVEMTRSVMNLIRINTLPENEGHSILLCGTLLPHIVEELNNKEQLYRLSIFPVVKDDDARRNKYADFSILKIKDSLT